MSIPKILISEKFHRQYKLLIEMESMLVNAVMKSTTEVRYDFAVNHVSNDHFECRLVQLDIFIHGSNNPLVNEVAEVTAAFNRMFNELHLKISHSGVVEDILNIDLILSKWSQTKSLMQQAVEKNDDLKEFISLSDTLFTDVEKIKQAIQANEFIQTYFGQVFQTAIPSQKNDSSRTNFFNTSYLPFKVSIDHKEVQESGFVEVNTLAVPYVRLDNSFKKNAYKSFEDKLDIKNLEPDISENSKHIIELNSGMLIHSEVIKQEIVHPEKLFTKMKYIMSLEGNNPVQVKPEKIKEDKKETRFKFF